MSSAFHEFVARELARLVAPVVCELHAGGDILRLIEGEDLPSTSSDIVNDSALAQSVRRTIDAIGEACDSIDQGNAYAIVSSAEQLLASIRHVFNILTDPSNSTTQTTVTIGKLRDYLLSQYLYSYHPAIEIILLILGVGMKLEGDLYTTYDLNKIPQFLRDPKVYILDEFFGGGPADFGVFFRSILPKIGYLLSYWGLSVSAGSAFGTTVLTIHTSSTPVTLLVSPIGGTLSPSGLRISPSGSFADESMGRYGRVLLRVDVTGSVEFDAFGVRFNGDRVSAEFSVSHSSNDASPLILGSESGSRIEIYGYSVSGLFRCVAADQRPEISFEAFTSRTLFTIKTDAAFLRNFLPPEGVVAELNLGISWSNLRGMHIRGGFGLHIALPMEVSIGRALRVHTLQLAVRLATDGVVISLGAEVDISIGPVAISAQNLGIAANASSADGTGNLGIFDISFAGTAPSGLGLAIAAGAVSGAGVISFDLPSGRYTGALSLTIGKLALSAVGILDTRAPGVSGYSFLIAISAAFPDIQLGMGFTLMGVGGLCGIQRSVSLDALESGVLDGSLMPLLFARDPVGQASQLVTGLQRVFPPTQDRYVFGPMFKLGWGTPTLVTADLGIILQLPAPIVIALIGTLRATFPKPQAAVVVLNIDIAGSVDPAEKRLAIDARIRDSRIAGYTLTGDMALRLRWGDRPDFALALGGFHRAYQPPEGFPELRRLSLGLSRGNTFRMTCAAYIALTSNSLQLGARAEIFVQTMGFNVLGYLEFNALVMFSPFSFRFDFAAGLALRRNTTVLASITVSGLVSGPQPWRVQGSASISILFFELSVSFDVEFGQPQVSAPAQPAGLWDRLQARVQDLRSWTALLPPETHRVVSLSSAGGTEAPLRLDPMGGLRFTQTEVPLERRITRFGEMSVDAPTTFRVQTVQIQERNALVTPVQESFAPGQYQHLTEAEKLSRPSFEPMDAGMSLCADAMQVRGVVECDVSYQTLVVSGDDETPPSEAWPYVPSAAAVAASLDFSGAQLAPLYTTGDERFLVPGARPLVVLDDEPYLVVHAGSLRPLANQERNAFPGSGTTTAPGAAHDALAAFLCTHPEAQGLYRVVPRYEAAMDRG